MADPGTVTSTLTISGQLCWPLTGTSLDWISKPALGADPGVSLTERTGIWNTAPWPPVCTVGESTVGGDPATRPRAGLPFSVHGEELLSAIPKLVSIVPAAPVAPVTDTAS